ncbi:hypothetical protein [Hymenobacter sp. IS2118]|uniref:glycosyl-4,4'-diaponeurosporenoate acyltransferase CrtO family protein n=1 Tax=Hymenobacter sp. IS2118 TaxID=1505605 RepID=UPI001F2B3CC1|nr:hypothetical protein [Hymenobacter sp. IS2118]
MKFGISLGFISFMVGLIMIALIKKTDFYNIKISNLNFIKNENINEIIGVGVIKWIVKNTFFKFFNQTIKINGRVNLMDLKFLRDEMTKSEIAHLFAFLFPCIFIIIKLHNQEYVFAFVILVTNILMNLYPSLLQQQNKRRIDKLIARFKN